MFKVGDRVWHKYLNEFCFIHKVVEESKGYYIYDSKHSPFARFDKEDNLHQTAQTMFEELGFTKEIDSKYDEVYSNHYGTVIFDTNSYVILMNDKKVSPVINIKIHLAIHQQMIEKGWIE